jgi:hypothetical protein
MENQVFQKGNTFRLKITCKDFSETLTDPTVLNLKVYDSTGTAVLTKAIGDLVHASTGVYYYDWSYTTLGDYVYEFSGTLAGFSMLAWAKFSIEYWT